MTATEQTRTAAQRPAGGLESWLSQRIPYAQAILRIMAAFLFIQAGTMKLFAFPTGMPPDGSTAELFTQVWFGGVLETFGGLLFLLGLFTRPVAFILCGMMAVAYFQFHAPGGFWPVVNGGSPAVLFCFVFLFFVAAGSGAWSADNALRARAPSPDTNDKVSS